MKTTPELPLRILSHNIRYATSSPFKGERPWSERRQLLLNGLQYNTRNQDSFICLQEVLHNQLTDILGGLNKTDQNWTHVGVGRDDGHHAGEYAPIIYRADTWDLKHWETVWLSKTPHKPSKDWDAASIRILTIGIFTHKASRQNVLAMNTHLDNAGSRSRYEAAHIILHKIRQYHEGPHGCGISGVFLAGDFNSEETQEAYQVLTGRESTLVDSAKMVDSAERYGNTITWTGFGYEDEPASRIDYILVGPGGNPHAQFPSWKAQGYAVLTNRFEDVGIYCSDHRAVVADVALMN